MQKIVLHTYLRYLEHLKITKLQLEFAVRQSDKLRHVDIKILRHNINY